MQRTQILEFTAMLGLGPPSRDSTGEWLKFVCPYAKWKHANGRDRKPSFGVYVSEDEDSAFHCFACHEKGPLVRLPLDLGHLRGGAFAPYNEISRQIQRTEFIKDRPVRPWIEEVEANEWSPKSTIVWPDASREYEYYSAAGHRYLRERGISWATAVALGLRYDPFQRRILFPVKDRSGRFGGFTGRAIDPPAQETDDGPLDRNGHEYLKVRDYFGLRKRDFLLGEHRCRAGRNERCVCVLVEGLFDYAFLTEVGVPNVIALMGTAITPVKQEKLQAYDGVILFLDNDEAGESAKANIAASLFRKVPVIEVTYPDDYPGADPASLPPSVIQKMLINRRQILQLAA